MTSPVPTTEAHTGRLYGALCGLCAAASFGLSAPLAKLLLGSVTPTLLAGLLYLGAALALWTVRLARGPSREAPLRRADALTLTAVVVSGGIAGPILMLLGLARLSAFAGSLLLNLEAPFTMLLAVVVFREHLARRAAVAALCILIGAAFLKLQPGAVVLDTQGVLYLAAACGCWALDNKPHTAPVASRSFCRGARKGDRRRRRQRHRGLAVARCALAAGPRGPRRARPG